MKHSIEILPCGSYCLARPDHTPYSLGEYQLLLKCVDPEAERLLDNILDSTDHEGDADKKNVDTFEAYKQARALLPETLKELELLRDKNLELHAKIAGLNIGRLDLEKLRAEEADGLNAEIESLRATVASQDKKITSLIQTGRPLRTGYEKLLSLSSVQPGAPNPSITAYDEAVQSCTRRPLSPS